MMRVQCPTPSLASHVDRFHSDQADFDINPMQGLRTCQMLVTVGHEAQDDDLMSVNNA